MGQPYLSPLVALKKLADLPLTKGAIHGSEIQARIQLINLTPKPNYSKTFKINL